MKITGVSTSSIFDRMNILTKDLSNDMEKLQHESITGQCWDYGLQLGSKVTDIIEFEQEKNHVTERLRGSELVKTRLSILQKHVEKIDDVYQNALQKMPLLQGNEDKHAIAQVVSLLQDSFQSTIEFFNTTVGGKYLFSGINTSEKPLQDYFAKDSLAKQSFDQMLKDFLKENSKNLPVGQNLDVSSMNGHQMTDFINKLEEKFSNDEYWSKNWSHASDQNIKYHSSNAGNLEVSVNVNSDAIRNFMLFSVIGVEFLNKDLRAESRNVLNNKMASFIGQGVRDLNHQSAFLGFSEKRIEGEIKFLQDKMNIIDTYILKSVSVDPYKASVGLTELINKIDMSYMITAKLQKLSLLNYL
ncbi:Flagellar hook-associated family protein [Candidatus Liberibacter solanacearum]|uniref:flagellar hook-associated family protein n=1 Tax=Candidatus Liberibacter solanacearum TaxID=556287 RepID=UPI003872A157